MAAGPARPAHQDHAAVDEPITFEAGADDIITLPLASEEFSFALHKAIARKQGMTVATGVALAPMICVLGPKGGTGKTLTSCNLALGLAERGHKVVVVDLDLQFGDVGLALGLAPERTVYDLAKAGGSLDGEKVEIHSTGRFYGNLHAPALIIEEGAVFEGNCAMASTAEQHVEHHARSAEVAETAAG